MQKKTNLDLLIIDPQYDFCNPKGSLFVPGADKDMERLAKLVIRLKSKINDIHVTMDCHRFVDIAHPIFWVDSAGKHPTPFTVITEADVMSGKWTTTNPGDIKRAVAYVKSLAANNRYALCIWPPHCLIGSYGGTIVKELFDAFLLWESEFAMVDYVTKGSNPYTEHYSAVQADVPDDEDPTTQLNLKTGGLIDLLANSSDVILLAGEALSHCVANTVLDIVSNFSDQDAIKKIILLEDASSSVPGFEQLGIDFVEQMKRRGMTVCKCDDFII